MPELPSELERVAELEQLARDMLAQAATGRQVTADQAAKWQAVLNGPLNSTSA